MKKNKKKVLIIGGSGFLGSHVADALTEKYYSVYILDKVKSRYLKKNQNMIIGDITDQTVIDKNIKNKNFVFNFAGIADMKLRSRLIRPLGVNSTCLCEIECRSYFTVFDLIKKQNTDTLVCIIGSHYFGPYISKFYNKSFAKI